MGRFEKWSGWLVALVVGLIAFGWSNSTEQEFEVYQEIAVKLEEKRKQEVRTVSAKTREANELRRDLEEAREQIAELTGSGAVERESDDVAGKFTGHWRLVSYENFAEDGTVTKREMTGRILYDGQGSMSAQLMPQGEDLEGENRRTRGYVAYFGPYEIDAEQGTVTHRPEGSTIFPWVGGELVRYYSFSDGNLELSLKDEERVTGTLTWERIE